MTPEQLAEIVQPGNHPENVRFEDLKPCGRCDGVVFLKGGVEATEHPDGTVAVNFVGGGEDLKASDLACEKEALRYLKPMPPMWLALHPGKDGISTPHGVEAMFTEEMFTLERTLRRPLRFIFASTEQGIYAAHPRLRKAWTIVKVAPTIWVFVFNPPVKVAAPAPVPAPVTPDVKQVVEAELDSK